MASLFFWEYLNSHLLRRENLVLGKKQNQKDLQDKVLKVLNIKGSGAYESEVELF